MAWASELDVFIMVSALHIGKLIASNICAKENSSQQACEKILAPHLM